MNCGWILLLWESYLFGGTGWVSTIDYYRTINLEINKRLGGHNAAQCILYSFNYADIDKLNQAEDHAGVGKMILEAALKIKVASVDCLVIPSVI